MLIFQIIYKRFSNIADFSQKLVSPREFMNSRDKGV